MEDDMHPSHIVFTTHSLCFFVLDKPASVFEGALAEVLKTKTQIMILVLILFTYRFNTIFFG